MNEKKLQSFSHRITRGVFIISFVNLVFASGLILLVKPALNESMTHVYISDLAVFLSTDARYTTLVQDDATTNQYLQTVSKFPWVANITLYNANINVIGSIGESTWEPEKAEFERDTGVITVGSISHRLAPIYSRDNDTDAAVAGYLHIEIDGGAIIAKINNVFYVLILLLIAGSGFIWVAM